MVSRRQVIAGTLAAGAASLDARLLSADTPTVNGTGGKDDAAKLEEILSEFLRYVGTSIVLRPEVLEGHVGIGSESPGRP